MAMPFISIVSFNILAPCWASPLYYPVFSTLDRFYRRERIIDLLKSTNADIFCLQECTDIEFLAIRERFNNDYSAFMAHHDLTYWSRWITEDPPYERNGPSIFVKKKLFKDLNFTNLPLSDSGNHAAVLTCKYTPTNTKFRIFSIHLDSDTTVGKSKEFDSLLEKYPESSEYIDIVAGDFNVDVNTSNFSNLLSVNNYVSILHYLGINGRTTPFSSSYHHFSIWGQIDHILVRHGKPAKGKIIDNGYEKLYPSKNGQHNNDEDNRIRSALNTFGSDHYPISGLFTF